MGELMLNKPPCYNGVAVMFGPKLFNNTLLQSTIFSYIDLIHSGEFVTDFTLGTIVSTDHVYLSRVE